MEEGVEMVGGEMDVLRIRGLVEGEGTFEIIIFRASVQGVPELSLWSVILLLGLSRAGPNFHGC